MQAMDRVYRYRMTITTDGNLSIRDEANDIWTSIECLASPALTSEEEVTTRGCGNAWWN